MNMTRPVNCVFYSHVWAVYMLHQAGLGDLSQQVLVELAENSNLAAIFAEQGKARFGLAGLLRPGSALESLAQTFERVPAPLILAPRPPVPVAALCSAVGLLASAPGVYREATLLVHVDEAPLFASAYPAVDRFSILWDVADLPTAALGALADSLVTNHCLQESSWGGFHWYQHPQRPVADAPERGAAFTAILADYPLLRQGG